MPCRVYQELLAGEPVDFIEALASVDFANVEIVRTRYFVAVIFPAHERLLIGVRGTQFAYDWLINVNVFKRRGESGTSFHRGFLREAEKLAEAVNDRLLTQYGKQLTRKNCAIYLAGHSLGGAVAALGVLEPFKQHPDISRRWKQLGVEDIPL